jgi:hypothetical protein
LNKHRILHPRHRPTSPSTRPKAERQNDLEEAFFAFHLLLGDLDKLRTEVSHAWAEYKKNQIDLIAASITTNTTVDLARSMTEDLKNIFARHGGGIQRLQVYHTTQCIGAGTTEEYRVPQGDDIYTSFQLLLAWRRLPQIGGDPQLKCGFYGYYDPHSDRNAKSSQEKSIEDKIVLFGMLEEFHFYLRTPRTPGSQPLPEDELTRGLRTMYETKEIILPLAFATTIFLDIHHQTCQQASQAKPRTPNLACL